MNKNIYKTIEGQNIHWNMTKYITPIYYRDIFHKIEKDLKYNPITVISGPRRTGKSVIIKQLINNLIDDNIDVKNILFYECTPLDDKEKLLEIITYYIENIKNQKEKSYIFIDEIQYISGFEYIIKLIYDNTNNNSKIVLTGSTSLDYNNDFKEQLLGRFHEYRIDYLSFREYLRLSNQDIDIELNNPVNIKNINNEFIKFLKQGRYPETVVYDDSEKLNNYMKNIIEYNIGKDAISFFKLYKPQILLNLYNYFIENNGKEISIKSLSKQIQGGDEKTISNYIKYLKMMGLIKIVLNTLDPLKSDNVSRKIYINTQIELNSKNNILDQSQYGYTVESYILDMIYKKDNDPLQKTTYYKERGNEIDFIDNTNKRVIEVKYREELKNINMTFLSKVSKKLKYEINVVSKDINKIENEIKYTPAYLFE